MINEKERFEYFSGNLSREKESELLEWVEESEENRRLFQKDRELFDVLLFASPEPAVKKRNVGRMILRWSIGVAATLIIGLGIAEYVGWRTPVPESYNTIYAPEGQRTKLTLADGTTVWLNSNSTLTYSSNFDKEVRHVKLNGEGYFKVAKNPNKPFVVETPQSSLKVLGTTFNVYAYGESDIFETSLVEGSVEVFPCKQQTESVVLKPNELLSIRGGCVTKSRFESDDFMMWREGIYSFDDMSFKELLRRLERYYNVTITVVNPKVLEYNCTGKFKQQDGISHILNVIKKDHKFTFSINEEGTHITIK